MKSKAFGRTLGWLVSLLLALSVGALAQNPPDNPTQFSGVIDAYTPQTGSSGPYEIHGPWSLQLSAPPVREVSVRPWIWSCRTDGS